MPKYIPMYRCQMCGQLLHHGNPTEVPPDQIPKLLARVVTNQHFIGTALHIAPQYLPHKCADGSGGLAAFVGFKKIQ